MCGTEQGSAPNRRTGPAGAGAGAGTRCDVIPGDAGPGARPPLPAGPFPGRLHPPGSFRSGLAGRWLGLRAHPDSSPRPPPSPPRSSLTAGVCREGAGANGAQGVSRAGARATHRRQTPERGLSCTGRQATTTIAELWRDRGGALHFLPREADRKAHRKARREPTREGGGLCGAVLGQAGAKPAASAGSGAGRGARPGFSLASSARLVWAGGTMQPRRRSRPPLPPRVPAPFRIPRAPGWAWNLTRAGRGGARRGPSGCRGPGRRKPPTRAARINQ